MARAGRHFAIGIASITLGFAGSGCTQVIVQEPAPQQVSRGHGPPPHAPAHGYRAKSRQGADLVFDSGLGVYVVANLPSVYFWGDFYFRMGHDGHWERCDRLDGAWIEVVDASVPPGLRGKKDKNAKSGKSKGHGPASRGGY